MFCLGCFGCVSLRESFVESALGIKDIVGTFFCDRWEVMDESIMADSQLIAKLFCCSVGRTVLAFEEDWVMAGKWKGTSSHWLIERCFESVL